MKIEEKDKQVWQTPEVIDLDINNDTTKITTTTENYGGYGPAS